jgi:hypothetical protein
VAGVWHHAKREDALAPQDNVTFLSWSAIDSISGQEHMIVDVALDILKQREKPAE